MHLIPHFITRPIRPGAPMKRPASPTPAAASSISSLHAIKKTKVLGSSPTRADLPTIIDLTSDDELSVAVPAHNAVSNEEEEDSSDDEWGVPVRAPKFVINKEDAMPSDEVDSGITFHPNSWPPLPAGANRTQWEMDFRNAKNQIKESRSICEAYARALAHIEMIKGKYGMQAPKPCEHAESAGVSSLIYHPLCYDWHME
ncbi:hypothetical protein T440DRAFT_479897 [Plenodomus tracheiphilus IPT5]|uniref:Uncharacterized protein n=1 Tax=Plenodomus tracheiphilus IPT5 TaxID=1408161 RepID=A0A6A7B4X7_9PLEO|nr:hypothetical protein T440DRAFT_479897 [Plenodomus tracheiphilus IPT5]